MNIQQNKRESISKFFRHSFNHAFDKKKIKLITFRNEKIVIHLTSFNWNLYRELTAKWPKKVKILSIAIWKKEERKQKKQKRKKEGGDRRMKGRKGREKGERKEIKKENGVLSAINAGFKRLW